MTLFSLPSSTLSLFIQDLGRLFCPKEYVGGRHFIKQVQVKQTRKRFSGGSEYPWSLRGKMTYFSGSRFFGCFEKHPKVVSGALRDGFRAREVFGSFEKRTPDILIKYKLMEKKKCIALNFENMYFWVAKTWRQNVLISEISQLLLLLCQPRNYWPLKQRVLVFNVLCYIHLKISSFYFISTSQT